MTERKITLFDIDNTIYNGYIIFPLVELQTNESLITIDCFDQLQDDRKAYGLGEITYETFARDAMKHWAVGLAGKSYLEVLDHAEGFLRGKGNKFFPYFSRVVHMLNEKTYGIYLVTAEPQFVSEAVMNIFPISGYASSHFETAEDVFTGKLNWIW